MALTYYDDDNQATDDEIESLFGWRDLFASFYTAKVDKLNPPEWENFVGNMNAYSFVSNKESALWITFHIQHDIKVGSLIYPHIHWSPSSNAIGNVVWKIECIKAKGHSQEVFDVNNQLNRTFEKVVNNDMNLHIISECENGIPALEPDTIFLVRISRDGANPLDTYPDKVFGLMMDIHYETDRVGTLNKQPNFYV